MNMDVPAITALVEQAAAITSGAARTFDALKSILGFATGRKDRVAAEAAIAELRDGMTRLYQLNLALAEQANSLQDSNVKLKAALDKAMAFEAAEQDYDTKTFAFGTFAKVPKPIPHAAERPDKLCPQCFRNKQYSLFAFEERKFHIDTWRCPVCRMSLIIDNGVTPDIRTGQVTRSDYLK